jgi:hypothetical protein
MSKWKWIAKVLEQLPAIIGIVKTVKGSKS